MPSLRLLLRFRFQLPVFVLQNDFFAIGEPTCDGSVKLTVEIFGLDKFLAFLVPFDARAAALAIFESGLLLLLAVGPPGFPNAVVVARNVMLFGKGLFAARIVLDPFAVAQAVFKPALRFERAVGSKHFPTAVRFAVFEN